MKMLATCLISLALLAGCGVNTKKHDLEPLMNKASTGMTELQVTQAMGAPSRVEIDGTTRRLVYDGESGGNITVTLVSDRVVDARRK